MSDDRAEIQDLNSRYAIAFDSGRLGESVDCWAEDGILDETEAGFGLFEGREAIRAFFRDNLMANSTNVVHMMFNHLVTSIDGDHGEGSVHCLVEIVKTDGSYARAHVKYNDRYVRVAGRWKFASRVITSSFPHEALTS
ncbi:nuclear transport factor 2 family protein [Streptomyces malaysiensis subsp. malaysiensis]|uniref:nuclear transport factor 2 family protein n=1 Tax=Streptomyces malaysiensis TaxID=92644 RepID=UPI0024BF9A2E|nr:nuclear transport factor 2 family protein [Streptomyces sp. NA07423]WHX18943.1 nuclear transport factor 2 family protein [Streptomyces sp. NA07423]